jgi:hypothetical protein
MSARDRTVDVREGLEVLPHHFEATIPLNAGPMDVFEYLDDHGRLAAHMERRSLMTMGSRMRIEMDAQRGRAAGSFIRLSGRVVGVRIDLEEAVTERVPPFRKTWATTSPPRLLVVGPYRMGFSIAEAPGGSSLRVFIRYALPRHEGGRFRTALARWYARWCVMRMLEDAQSHFGTMTLASARTHEPMSQEEP